MRDLIRSSFMRDSVRVNNTCSVHGRYCRQKHNRYGRQFHIQEMCLFQWGYIIPPTIRRSSAIDLPSGGWKGEREGALWGAVRGWALVFAAVVLESPPDINIGYFRVQDDKLLSLPFCWPIFNNLCTTICTSCAIKKGNNINKSNKNKANSNMV